MDLEQLAAALASLEDVPDHPLCLTTDVAKAARRLGITLDLPAHVYALSAFEVGGIEREWPDYCVDYGWSVLAVGRCDDGVEDEIPARLVWFVCGGAANDDPIDLHFSRVARDCEKVARARRNARKKS